MAVMAAKTIEACAPSTVAAGREPPEGRSHNDGASFKDAIDRLTVVTGAATYEIGVMSARDLTVSLTAFKAADGTTACTCSTNEDRGGCQALRRARGESDRLVRHHRRGRCVQARPRG
jgi:hypothetical protein